MKAIGTIFLDELEKFIEEKLDRITCKDVYNLYFGFFELLKERTGSSGGFTGLSEVIVFMILKKMIEKKYGEMTRSILTKDTYYFANSRFAIGRGLTIRFNKQAKRPDISIWKDQNPLDSKGRIKIPDGVIKVKIYPTSGISTVKEAFENLKKMREKAHESFKGMLIFLIKPGSRSEQLIEKLLEEEKEKE